MTWIVCSNPGTRKLYNREIMGDGPAVEFSENGKAQVPEKMAKALAKQYDSIKVVKSPSKKKTAKGGEEDDE